MNSTTVDLMNLVENYKAPIRITQTNYKFTDVEKKEYLFSFSNSSYEAHSWFLDKINSDENLRDCRRTISFDKVSYSQEIEEQLKQWTLSLLLQGLSISTVQNKIHMVMRFIEHSPIKIKTVYDIDKSTILSYKDHLFGEKSSLATPRATYRWHIVMEWLNFCGCQELALLMNRTVTPKIVKSDKRAGRYIPSSVLEQLDSIFTGDTVPLAYQIVYWVLRLYPNRIGEVISLKTDCLKQYSEDSYTLSIPTFKQSGSFDKGQPRMIRIRNEGFGAYLIDLIQQQVNRIKAKEVDSDFLLYEYKGKFTKASKKFTPFQPKTLSLIQEHNFKALLNSLIKIFNVRDEKGEPAHVTSHMFRHNNITDRLDSGLFTPIDLATLTGHHNTRMITDNYNHPNHDKESQTLQDNADGYKPVLFQGKVIGGNSERNYQRILKRKMAFEIDGIGICSDYRECGKDVYSCLSCPNLVVEADQIDRYRQEKREWEDKLDMARRLGQENLVSKCENNIKHLQDIIARIEEAVKACEERKEQ